MRVPVTVTQFQPRRVDVAGYLPLEDEDFIWCENESERGGPLVGITIDPVEDPDKVVAAGGIYLAFASLDEIRQLQAQLQRVIDDNTEEA